MYHVGSIMSPSGLVRYGVRRPIISSGLSVEDVLGLLLGRFLDLIKGRNYIEVEAAADPKQVEN
jgi:hypothetical protein